MGDDRFLNDLRALVLRWEFKLVRQRHHDEARIHALSPITEKPANLADSVRRYYFTDFVAPVQELV